MGAPMGAFFAQLFKIWQKSEKTIAAILIVLVAVGEHLNVALVRESALGALSLMVIYTLFDLTRDRKQLENTMRSITANVEQLAQIIRPRKRFKDIGEARPAILECMKECHRTDQFLEVKWIGMTMWNVFSVLTAVFNQLADERMENVSFKVAMLEGPWLDQNRINGAWDLGRAASSSKNMRMYFEEKSHLKWDCAVHTYAHMPCIHGGLINGRVLFLGISQWEKGNLHAGERDYALYTNLTEEDGKKIGIFEGWFHVCFEGRPSNLQAAAAGVSSSS
jgi:hypothetical protein